MAVTLTAEVQVDTKDLRNALRAVTPHAEPNKTGDLDDEHRVRLVIDGYHVNVLASNGSTAVMAIVSIEEDTRRKALDVDDGPLIVDLTPRHCRLILGQFKAKKTDPEGVDQVAALARPQERGRPRGRRRVRAVRRRVGPVPRRRRLRPVPRRHRRHHPRPRLPRPVRRRRSPSPPAATSSPCSRPRRRRTTSP
jgi:hypothetical protein